MYIIFRQENISANKLPSSTLTGEEIYEKTTNYNRYAN